MGPEVFLSLAHPDDYEDLKMRMADTSLRPEASEFEVRIRTEDGSLRWILSQVMRLDDQRDGLRRSYVVLQDISKRKLSEEKIRQQNEELAIVNGELERFSGIVAHDLKNPLSSIKLSADLLDRAKSLDEVGNRSKSIKAAVSRMENLIDEILSFAKSESTTPLDKEMVSLTQLMQVVEGNLAAALRENHGEIKIVTELPTVLGHPSQLLQVFQNLISNALKFKADRDPIVKIAALENEDTWTIIVEDNGLGIELEKCANLFEPFQRFHPKIAGTGLGLSICKKIIERHGGKIGVESAIGIGSKFSLTLAKI